MVCSLQPSTSRMAAATRPAPASRAILRVRAAAAPPPPALTHAATNGHHTPAAAQALPQPAAAPPVPASPPAPPALLPPAAAYANVVAMGAAKAEAPFVKTLWLGILAGVYISFGGFLSVTAATMLGGMGVTNPIFTRLVFGSLFPFGLLITLVCGAELFTGNTAFVMSAVLEKKATFKGLVRNWVASYAGNFIGSLLLVGLVVASGVLDGSPVAAKMAVAKSSLPFGQAFVRGLLCNWLVCSAVWMASAASTLPGKMLAAYLPVMAFITLGLEHSVANMFFCSLGIASGAPVSVGQFLLGNLLPVTLGNVVAGAACMAGSYSFAFGALGKPRPAAAA